MRILHIGLTAFMGGTESFVYNYMRELVNRDIYFDFVDIYGDGLANEELLESVGSKIYRLDNYKVHPIKVYQGIKNIIYSNQYKIVHVHMQSAANLLPAKAVISCGVKPILHSHNSAAVGSLRRFLHNINVKKLRNLDSIHLACSEAAGDWMWGKNNYTVIPNAVSIHKYHFDSEWRKEIRNELHVSNETYVIGTVGRIEYEKNPYFFLELGKKLKGLNHKNYIILMIGSGNMKDEISKKVITEQLTDIIKIYGPSQVVNKMYSAMDYFILPSLFEGLPFVGVEAQACGLPVIFSTNVTSEIDLTDKVKHLDLTDVDEWLRTINKYVKESLRNRKYIEDRFRSTIYNIDNSADKLAGIYSSSE